MAADCLTRFRIQELSACSTQPARCSPEHDRTRDINRSCKKYLQGMHQLSRLLRLCSS
jgi:hypothetical protein